MNRFNEHNRHSVATYAPMTNEQLMAAAPSIFAREPWHKMSERYAFVPTIDVVEKMRSEGFAPVSAIQARTRIDGKGEFTKHMIRFRDVRQGDQAITRHLGQVYPELVLVNSHDGASAYKLDSGLFRLICLNGMVVGDGVVEHINVRHTGSADQVIDATYEIVDQMPKVMDSVESWQALRLPPPAQQAFAKAALALRYDEGEAPIAAEQVIQPRRYEDRGDSLWQTFNVAQENLTQGGVRGRNPETLRRAKTRSVQGISENVKLNKALWTLAEEMRKIMG
jgi:hypothetical protein